MYKKSLHNEKIMLPNISIAVIVNFLWLYKALAMSSLNEHSYFMDMSGPENDLAEIISAKSYLPKETRLPEATIIKNEGDEVTYLLSKLSDEELIKLLSEQPTKHEYDLKDIAKIAIGINPGETLQHMKEMQAGALKKNILLNKLKKKKKYAEGDSDEQKQLAIYRLENKKIKMDTKSDSNYLAFKKLNSLLKDVPGRDFNDDIDEEKKELLFDLLVKQLKSLCCKKPNRKQESLVMSNYKSIEDSLKLSNDKEFSKKPTEYMFLVINDEIKSNSSDELIIVDPETLQQNSSVLLLGPISTPLTDRQLNIIMNRITTELSKPEYLSLLQQLSEGTLSNDNLRLMKNYIHGPQSRRYIKPHRCNHQSKLARVYGGPKWLICTGYINLNTPSLYD